MNVRHPICVLHSYSIKNDEVRNSKTRHLNFSKKM